MFSFQAGEEFNSKSCFACLIAGRLTCYLGDMGPVVVIHDGSSANAICTAICASWSWSRKALTGLPLIIFIFSDTGSIQVTWRVKKSKDRFFVIDLLVADISLVVTKRSEFNSMLKTVDFNLSEFNKKLLSQNESSYQKIKN